MLPAAAYPTDSVPTADPQARRELRVVARLMRYHQLHAVFQPLADLRTGAVYGHEALIRGPVDTPLHAPDALLALARRAGIPQAFELFCLRTVLADWHRACGTGRLFVNIGADALVQAVRRHGPDALLRALRTARVDPRQLVLEITEHERVPDLEALREVARQVHACGAMLALDDFGDGHSSLRLWSELRPDFVKIDKYFTRGIGLQEGGSALHGGPEKIQVLRAIQGIANIFGTRLVAEGIETVQELCALRELGISHGQGYLLGRPAMAPRLRLEAAATAALATGPAMPPAFPQRPARPGVLRGLTLIDAPALAPGTSHNELAGLFHARHNLHAVALVDGDRPVALVNRQHFMDHYATLFFREVHGKKPCITHANRSPRVIELDDDIDELIAILTSHDQRYLNDGFIVTEQGRYVGLGTGEQLVRSVTEARIEAARHANPLTLLPGNIPINLHIERLLGSGTPFVACHADLNDFKPFNDHYGYWRGDEMIRLAARLALAHADPQRDFVGHVGGDDFMVLFQSPDWRERCERIVDGFAQQALALFDPEARAAGGIHGEDRDGQPRFFPCTTLSIGAVPVGRGAFRHADEVASLAALAKHDAKATRQGLFLREAAAARRAVG
ncbi:phosphodiesterase [Xylophilus sp. ASV27]|uniref:phosphodiesterase n=1 Tax=Xylophilus sp. ASV27 TaxID=2795129 RepID=UPI0018EAF641